MITSTWLMVLAPGFTEEMFEEWYLKTHIGVAKQSQDLKHYSISRAFAEQPPQAHGTVFRIAQLWWDSPEKLQASLTSYSGNALRGDAILNMAPNPSIALTEDVQLEVKQPVIFDTFRGQYRTSDGTVTKVLAFGMSEDPGVGEWYRTAWADLGLDERVREHIFGTSIRRTLEIGLLDGAALPSPGQGSWDWMLELWFDSKSDAVAFLNSPEFGDAWRELAAKSGETHLSVHRCQEIFVSVDPWKHDEE